jgi:hypothetical protein
MKYKEHMNMSERDNFNKAIEGYINDNLPFIKEGIKSTTPADLAQASLDHYNYTVEGYGQKDEELSDEQKDHFLATAKRLFQEGRFA